MPKRLNRFQIITAANYADGLYAGRSFDEAMADNTGDTLITFLMREMNGMHSKDEALRRLDTAIAEIHEVQDAIRKA